MSEVRRLRAGDADREAVAEVLRDAHAEGRLRLDELEERLEAAFAAVHLDELPPLTADLPVANRSRPAGAGSASLPVGAASAYAPGAAGETRPPWPGRYQWPASHGGTPWPAQSGRRFPAATRRPVPPFAPVLFLALAAGLVLLLAAGVAWPLLWLVVAAVLLRGGPRRWAAHGSCGGSRRVDDG